MIALKRKWLQGMWLGLLLPVVIVVVFHVAYLNKIYPGVRVAGVDLSNRTEGQAINLLEQRAAQARLEQPGVQFSYGGNQWHILKADIKFEFLPQQTATRAFGVGRGNSAVTNLFSKWKAWFGGVEVPFEFKLDEETLVQRIATISAELTIPAIPPEIEVIKGKVIVKSGEPGQEVDTDKIIELAIKSLERVEARPIELPVKQVEVGVTSQEIEEARKRAEALVGKKVLVNLEDNQWVANGDEVLGWIEFKGGFNQQKLRQYVESLAKIVDRPAQNAAFQYVEGRVTEFKPARMGIKVDIDAATGQLEDGLKQLETTETKEVAMTLAAATTEPDISLDEVNSLGLVELLGRGKSTFRGSIPGRINNVALSASRINGVLVKPGETFSFNQWVGEISAATGYQQAYVIRSGATVLDDGGGVCQTSTTLFRAVLNAGLPIVERKAHSYRVGYYEQDSKPGFDATVFAPTADLKFINDTPAHILVQTVVAGTSLTVDIYGTSDGRKVELSNHRLWDVVPAPPPRYQDDPSIPSGQTKQVDWAAAGSKVKFDYTVTRNGETIFSKTFYSQYQPWQAVYLRGTATN